MLFFTLHFFLFFAFNNYLKNIEFQFASTSGTGYVENDRDDDDILQMQKDDMPQVSKKADNFFVLHLQIVSLVTNEFEIISGTST